MSALTLRHLIAIYASLPAEVIVTSWKDGRVEGDTIVFAPHDAGEWTTAGEAAAALSYLPCLLTKSTKDFSDMRVYTRHRDSEDLPVAVTPSRVVSRDSELVVKSFDEGKYTAIYYAGRVFKVLRYGGAWRDLIGDKFITSMFFEAVGSKS